MTNLINVLALTCALCTVLVQRLLIPFARLLFKAIEQAFATASTSADNTNVLSPVKAVGTTAKPQAPRKRRRTTATAKAAPKKTRKTRASVTPLNVVEALA